MVNTTNSNILFKGSPVKIEGSSLKIGSKLPAFKLTAGDLSDLDSATLAGKVVVISVIPSIDTPVCSLQTKAFNRAAADLSKDVVILTVSVDLPFAQSRWCGQEKVENITIASDFKYRTFGKSFGVVLPDLGLLCRAVFVADRAGLVKYVEYVEEITSEPSYNDALVVVRDLLA